MVDFGRDQVCHVPGGSVVERAWDIRQDEGPAAYTRPRMLAQAEIQVTADHAVCISLTIPSLTAQHPTMFTFIAGAPGTSVSYEV